ncbi:MAG: energy transducer TonB [Pseudomonadota bacterium]
MPLTPYRLAFCAAALVLGSASLAEPAPAKRKPVPLDPQTWIAPEIIEARACRGERCFVGFVGYTLLVNREGRATDCAVTRTSGDTVLDIETCNLLLRHARFEPATNAKGEPVKGRYASAVTWTGRRGSESSQARQPPPE